MLGEIRSHRPDDAKVVDALGDVWEERADRQSAASIIFEFPGTTQGVAVVVELRGLHFHLERLPMFLLQARLRIECVDLRWTTIHVEKNNVARFGSKMRCTRSHRTSQRRSHGGSGKGLVAE